MPTAGPAPARSHVSVDLPSRSSAQLVVGVVPASAHAGRRRLFEALEQVFPVRFEGRAPQALEELDGLVLFEPLSAGPALRADTPLLAFRGSDGRIADTSRNVELGWSPSVSLPFRGRRIPDRSSSTARPIVAELGDEILATRAGLPIWLRRRGAHVAAVRARELRPTETLRDLFKPGDFMSLLPLVQVLRQITDAAGWVPPPLRAAIVLDDPNLHWTSYGHVRFPALVEHARAHGYHAAVAAIPLDLWYFDRRSARIFQESSDAFSLAIHGNTHVRRELARTQSQEGAIRLVAQALARVERFERRSGLGVSRVMIPPHGDFDQMTLGALADHGFDAACWSPKPRSVVSGFDVADFADGGLPSIPRSLLGRWDDLPFRAFLDQPVVLEGHHTDLAGGLDVLEEASNEIGRLGDPAWMSLGGIAETNAAVHRSHNILHVRMYSRRTVLAVPEGVETLVVETPAYAAQQEDEILVRFDGSGWDDSSSSGYGQLPVSAGVRELRLVRASPGEDVLQSPSWRPWPVLRRVLSESRDRALPAISALQARAMARR